MYLTINSNNLTFGIDNVSVNDVVERSNISSIEGHFVPAGYNNPAMPGNRQQTCQIIIHLNGGKKKIFDLADIDNRLAGWTLTQAGITSFISAIRS